MINQASLISRLESEELIKCVDLFDYNNSIYIIEELMDEGTMTKFCCASNMHFSEDFYRYTLYKVAKGLHAMHKRNLVHKYFNSDCVYYSEDGSIKIMEAGYECLLSER